MKMDNRFKLVLIASLLLVIIGLILIFWVAPQFEEIHNSISSIGLSFITAGIISITIDRISLSSIASELNSVVENGLNELEIRKYGVHAITNSTPYNEIYESINESNEFTLVQTWSPDLKNILCYADKLLQRGGKVSIYLLHPESMAAIQRSIDLEEEESYVPEKIRSDMSQVRSLFRRLIDKHGCNAIEIKNRLNLFFYSSLPAFAVYKTNKKAWLAFYWHGLQLDSRMNLKINNLKI